jgi:hypothetical protein
LAESATGLWQALAAGQLGRHQDVASLLNRYHKNRTACPWG